MPNMSSGQDGSDGCLHLHAAVRIEVGDDDRFRVEHLTRKRRWEVGRSAVAVLVSFAGGATREAALDAVPAKLRPRAERWITEACGAGLLISADDADHAFARALRREWEDQGWAFASEYHLATFGFPFVDYAAYGVDADSKRMAEYLAREPDSSLDPTCPADGEDAIPLPDAHAVCERLRDATLPPYTRFDRRPVERRELMEILAATFGELRSAKAKPADRIRRTSPSGGARHPCEGYLFALDVEDLPSGIYHCCWRRDVVHRVRRAPDTPHLRAAFPWFFRFGEPLAIVAITATFERNMFRYREPRTLRTIFMDAGHLCETFHLLCAAYGLPSLVHHGIVDELVERLIGVHYLEEAAIAAAAVGVQE